MTSSAFDEFGRDHGLIHEAIITGRKVGWGRKEWSRLAHDQAAMHSIREYLRGYAVISRTKRKIDLDAPPFLPRVGHSWSVEQHKKGGQFEWNAANIALHLDDKQKVGQSTNV